ncbi:CHAT domain-containing protein [Puia sp. P3]|uniref:CHAT domain-containing protein n=1 Tax=Puia sp. P3 TaxID=3423952 RepID=UPI003D66FDC8
MSGGDPRSALGRFRNCADVVRRGSLPDTLLFQPYLYSGSCHYDLYDLDSSLHFYKVCESILERHPGLKESERLYNKIGVLYYETGDYLRSIYYFGKALDIVLSSNPGDSYLAVNYRNNIANSWLRLRKYDEAINALQQLLPYRLYRQQLLNNLGTAFLEKGRPSTAIDYFRKAGYQTPFMYMSLARAWMGLGQYDSAEVWLKRSISYYDRSNKKNKNEDLGIANKLYGDLLVARGLPGKAIGCYQNAVIQLDKDFNDTRPEANPSAFPGLHSYAPLFEALVGKARAMLAAGRVGGNASVGAYRTYESALTLLSTVARGYYSDEARLFLLEKANGAYQEAIDLGYKLYCDTGDTLWLESIFNYAEECKAAVLQTRLGEPGIDVLTAQARTLAIDLRKKKAEATRIGLQLSASTEENNRDFIASQLRETELAISRLQEKLEGFPEYRTRLFQRKRLLLRDVKVAMAAKKGALLSYFTGAGKLYCFYVTGRSAGCITAPWDDSLVTRVKTLAAALHNENNDRVTQAELATDIAARILGPVFGIIKDFPRLVIAPYNEIGYIPFEILPVSGGNLLVSKFAVSYCYSANFLTTSDKKPLTDYRVLALAPFGDGVSGDQLLPRSAEEVKDLPGEVLTGRQANKNAFLAKISNYPILHLATHAIADDSDARRSYIAFYGSGKADSASLLFEPEISQLSLGSSPLVILSACETGKGRLINGEGIISLSRAFMSAGSNSVITSLWKADDAATSYIARRIHFYLKNGADKDRSLQLAKIDYLKDPKIEQRYKEPRYWAHLVIFGDTSAVTERPRKIWAVLLIPAYALCVIFLILYRRKRRRRPFEGGPAAS